MQGYERKALAECLEQGLGYEISVWWSDDGSASLQGWVR